tara:strand:- start:13156 stop:14958 length:1803 start_codon:yes stop_codon:yes gene_type:complete
MGEIRDYSVTADDNNSTPPAGAPEGMAPSTVNNTMREAYARIKRWYEDCQGAKTTGGSSNAYTLAAARTVASYAAGDSYMFKANHTNTSAGSTLNVDSVGAKAIVTPTGAAIAAGSITSGGVYLVAYEASVDKFMLIGGSHSGGDNPFIYNSSPTVTLENSTSEDTSGGRESQVVFKGLQSGSEESTLVKITASHEGTSDDQKGQLVIGVNDGNDNDAPTTAITVASTGNTTLAGNLIIPDAGNIGSASDTDAMAIASTGIVTFAEQPSLPYAAPASTNYIYNGDTSICQRAASVANIGNGDSGYHVQDRWYVQENGSVGGEVTMSRATEVPNGFQYSMKFDCTTAESSLAADEAWLFQQRLEGQDLYALKKGTADALPVTLSFWVNATKTGTNIVRLYDNNNTRHIAKSYTVSSSNTWEYKTITYAGDTTGIFNRDNATSLQILFYLAAGSNYTSGTLATSWAASNAANAAVGQVNNLDSTSNNFHITGIQLQLGNTATAFQHETYAENLARCQRYFYKNQVDLYDVTRVGIYGYLQVYFPVQMRVAPTLSAGWPTASGISGANLGATITQDVANAYAQKTSTGFYFYVPNNATASAEL